MSDRAASSTAVLVCQGRACVDGRVAVGRFSDPFAHQLLDDSELLIVDDVRASRLPSGVRARIAYEMVRQTGLTMVPRTIAIDEAVRARAAGQVVILGAGLDARAWRMPELAGATVFEVDHPASQQDKRRRIGERKPVGRVEFVAVDLAGQPLAPTLTAAGFDPGEVTTWVWEGVIPYLTADAVENVVKQVAGLSAPGSRLVVQYQQPAVTQLFARPMGRRVMRLFKASDPLAGEPWRSFWKPGTIGRLLNRHGFGVLADDGLTTLIRKNELVVETSAAMRSGRVAVAVRQ